MPDKTGDVFVSRFLLVFFSIVLQPPQRKEKSYSLNYSRALSTLFDILGMKLSCKNKGGTDTKNNTALCIGNAINFFLQERKTDRETAAYCVVEEKRY